MTRYHRNPFREFFEKYVAPALAVALALRLLWLAGEWIVKAWKTGEWAVF